MSEQQQQENEQYYKISKSQKKIYNQSYYKKKYKQKQFNNFQIIYKFILQYWEIDFEPEYLEECFNLFLQQNNQKIII